MASCVWQGWALHCLNLKEQLIGVTVLLQFVSRAFLHATRSVTRSLPGDTSLTQPELLGSFVLRRACARTLFMGFVREMSVGASLPDAIPSPGTGSYSPSRADACAEAPELHPQRVWLC